MLRLLSVLGVLVFYAAVLSVAWPIAAYAQAAAPATAGVDLGLAAILVFGARQLAEILAKLIPDTSSGLWGVVRMVLKTAALYVPNK